MLPRLLNPQFPIVFAPLYLHRFQLGICSFEHMFRNVRMTKRNSGTR